MSHYHGRIFSAQGGYVNKVKQDRESRNQAEAYSKSLLELNSRQFQFAELQAKYTRRSFGVNVGIAIATGIAAIYYTAELAIEGARGHLIPCAPWLSICASFAVGAGLSLAIRTLLHRKKESRQSSECDGKKNHSC